MAGEGEFPKINGDILYASEVNSFNPKFFMCIEQQSLLDVSGTNFITTGDTIFYNGEDTSQTISKFIIANTGVMCDTAGNEILMRYRISGAGINMVTNTKIVDNKIYYMPLNHIFTSGAITSSGGNIGSNYIISLEGKSDGGGNTYWINDFTCIGW